MKGLLILIFMNISYVYCQDILHDWSHATGNIAADHLYDMDIDSNGNIYAVGGFQISANFNPQGGSSTNSAGVYDIFIWKLNTSGSLVWLKKIGNGNANVGYGVHIDSNNDVIISGMTDDGTIDLDPGPGVDNRSPITRSFLLVKLDSDGNYIWGEIFGRTDYGESSITSDGQNNIYVTGLAKGPSDWDPGVGTANINGDPNDYGVIFVMKVSSNGNFEWIGEIGEESHAKSYSITCDKNTGIYITGYFSDTVDFDPTNFNDSLISNGVADIFILKLDTSGNYVWSQNIGGSGGYYDFGNAIHYSDISNRIYVTGMYTNPADFDFGPGVETLNSVGSGDVFLLTLDTAGNYIWAKGFGGTSEEQGLDIDEDVLGDIYISGHFKNTVDFDPGTGSFELSANPGLDGFVCKLSDQGDFINAWQIEIDPDLPTPYMGARSIRLDNENNIFIAGNYTGAITVGPTSGSNSFSSNGDDDFFVAKWHYSDLGMIQRTDESILIYPNPTNSSITVVGSILEVDFYNSLGQFVLSSNENQIDVSHLPSGIYQLIIKTTDQDQPSIRKLVIE